MAFTTAARRSLRACVPALALAAVLALPAEAATIEKIVESGGVLVLKLTKEERKTLAAGDQISVATPAGKSVEGMILSVKGSRARVAVTAKRGTFKAGRSVQVASSSPTMTVAPTRSTEAPVMQPEAETARQAVFTTNFFHPGMVSPAQLYQVRGARTDFATTYSKATMSHKADSYKVEAELTGPTLYAGAGWGDPRKDLTLALAVHHQESKGRIKADIIDLDDELVVTETSFAPAVAYAVRPGIYAALAYEVVQRHHAGDFYSGSHNLSWARPRPGVVGVNGAGEVGVAFAPKVREESTTTDETGSPATVTATEPAQTFVHGRGRLPSGDSVYGVMTHNQNRVFNIGETTGWRNNAAFILGTTKKVSGESTEIDIAATANTPAHAGNDSKSSDTIIHYGGRLGVERRLDAGRFGAAVRYSTGNDRYDDSTDESVKISSDEMALELTGSLKL